MDLTGTKRVLIYRLGSLGDMVVAVPALHLVKRTFPDARRLLLTNFPVHAKAPAAAAVLGNSGLVDGFISYPIGARGFLALAALWWRIVRFRPQVLIYLAESRGESVVTRDALFFRACGIKKIIGLPRGDAAESIYFPDTGLWESEASRLVRTIRVLGECDLQEKRNWDLLLTEEERRTARSALARIAGRPFIICGPGTKVQAKDWGEENWKQLLGKLSAELRGHALVMVGAKEEAQISDYAARQWQGPVVNLCGQLTPRESAAVIEQAELFLGPDSGPMHLAAISDVSCAIPFAARMKPGIWYPAGRGHRVIYHQVDCAGCTLETCEVQKKKCLTSIAVDEMLAAALEAWRYGRKERERHPV